MKIRNLPFGVWDQGESVDGMVRVPNIFGTQHDAADFWERPHAHPDTLPAGARSRGSGCNQDEDVVEGFGVRMFAARGARGDANSP